MYIYILYTFWLVWGHLQFLSTSTNTNSNDSNLQGNWNLRILKGEKTSTWATNGGMVNGGKGRRCFLHLGSMLMEYVDHSYKHIIYIIYSIYIYIVFFSEPLSMESYHTCTVSVAPVCIYIYKSILSYTSNTWVAQCKSNIDIKCWHNAFEKAKKVFSLSRNDHTLWSLIHLSFIITFVVQTYLWKNMCRVPSGKLT